MIPPPAPPSDRHEIVRGNLLTMDRDRLTAEAMAIHGDRIIGVGDLTGMLALCPSSTPVADLGTATILPGLTDAHLHMQRGGLKIIYELGDSEHPLAEVIDTMDATGFRVWGDVPPTIEERIAGIRLIQPLLHALGLTGVIDPAVTLDELRGYQEAWRRGELTMRVVAMPYPDVGDDERPDVDAAMERLEGVGIGTGFGDDLLRIGGIKVYFDGEGMRGEALLSEPWPHSGSHGHQRIPTAEFERLVEYCAGHGWSVGVHAVGGAAVDAVVAAFAKADAVSTIAGRQWQVIHGYLETPIESMRVAAELGVIASAQPSIALKNAVGLVEKLGARAERIDPLRSWIDAGATVALGSDGPFFPFDPRELIWSAVTRRVRGRAEPIGPDEAITMEEALESYTVNSAIAAFAGNRRGMLKPGLLADWTAIDVDPIADGADALLGARIIRTVVGGRTVFTAPLEQE